MFAKRLAPLIGTQRLKHLTCRSVLFYVNDHCSPQIIPYAEFLAVGDLQAGTVRNYSGNI